MPPIPIPLHPTTEHQDRYTIVDDLKAERSGFSETLVHSARHDLLGHSVVLKRCNPMASSPVRDEVEERLRQEARWLAAQDHPALVKVLDFFDGPEGATMVMELAGGFRTRGVHCRTLADYIDAIGKVPTRLLLPALEPLLGAVAAVHRAGIAHLDLSPDNLVLSHDFRCKLIDFGVATWEGEVTDHDGFFGTRPYAAPEQYAGRGDQRSDVFALGVMIVEALTGRCPYDDDEFEQAIEEGRALPEPDLDGVPAQVVNVVRSCLAANPSARPADAGVLHLHFRELIGVDRPAPLERPPATTRSRLRAALTLGALGFALMATLVFGALTVAIATWAAEAPTTEEADDDAHRQ